MPFLKNNKFLTVLLIFLSLYLYINFTRIVENNSKVDRENIHYVNDLYMSSAMIYNKHLTDEEQKMYMQIFKNTKKYENKVNIKLADYNCDTTSKCSAMLLKVHEALMVDHPELMNYATITYKYQSDNLSDIVVTIKFALDSKVKETINIEKTKRIIDNLKRETDDMTDKEKIKYVYEWIGDNNTYDHLFTHSSKNQSIYNVFMKHNAVCAAFAKASQIIFQNIGIESYAISGYSTGPHMWNVIKYQGKYYYYDSTVAASINDKTNPRYYGGLNQEKMNYYQADFPEWYPKIEIKSALD